MTCPHCAGPDKDRPKGCDRRKGKGRAVRLEPLRARNYGMMKGVKRWRCPTCRCTFRGRIPGQPAMISGGGAA